MTLLLGRDPLAALLLASSSFSPTQADKVILWAVLPDGAIWIYFLKQVYFRHPFTPASQRFG